MIQFRQKEFSEYDAMRQLYVELDRNNLIRNRVISIIDQSALIPVLRGNNVVIEKFTQAPRIFGKDRYRLYLKIGARAKMPDDVRLPQYSQRKSLGNLNLGINYGFDLGGNNNNDKPSNDDKKPNDTVTITPDPSNKQNKKKEGKIKGKNYSDSSSSNIFRQKEFGDNRFLKAEFRPNIDFLNYHIHKLLGDAIKYDKKDRSLVLEVDSIQDALRALNILPFGLGYKIYLLNS